MVKNIVFDMGGVLIDFNSKKTLQQYFDEKYRDIVDREMFSSYVWREVDRGTMTFEEAIAVVTPKVPEEIRALVTEMLTDFYPYMPPFPEMCDFIKRIKAAGYKVYLLSNASPRVFDRLFSIPALQLMDGYFVSCMYKLLKPEPEIYQAFCDKFNVKPEECFFIDDVEKNINGAVDCGWHGYVYKAPDYDGLEKALNEVGVYF